MQQVAVLDTCTGEVSEHQVAHEGTVVEEFWRIALSEDPSVSSVSAACISEGATVRLRH